MKENWMVKMIMFPTRMLDIIENKYKTGVIVRVLLTVLLDHIVMAILLLILFGMYQLF